MDRSDSTNDNFAQNVDEIQIKNWISQYSAPVYITGDQGRQFESRLFYDLAKSTVSEEDAKNPQTPTIQR